MRLNPQLQFDGQCEAAFKFYEECLGGRIVVMMPYAYSPIGEQIHPDWRKKILHTTLTVGNYLLQGSDVPAESYRKPQGFSVMLNIEDVSEAADVEAFYRDMSAKGVLFTMLPKKQDFGGCWRSLSIPKAHIAALARRRRKPSQNRDLEY